MTKEIKKGTSIIEALNILQNKTAPPKRVEGAKVLLRSEHNKWIIKFYQRITNGQRKKRHYTN